MIKYTKKWDKEFTKRYSNAIKELQSLENEFKQMVIDNPDAWISVYPDETNIEFGECKGFYVTHVNGSYDGDTYMPEFEHLFTIQEIVKEFDGHKVIKYTK